MSRAATITVEVVYALPERAWRMARSLPGNATAGMAVESVQAELQMAGLPVSEVISGALGLAIFGRAAEWNTPLHDGDRIELLRPLLADPKQARRERVREKPVRGKPAREKPAS